MRAFPLISMDVESGLLSILSSDQIFVPKLLDITAARLKMSNKIWFCIVLLEIIVNGRIWLCAELQILSHHTVQDLGMKFKPVSNSALFLIINAGKGKGLVLAVVIHYGMLTK